MRVGCHFDVCEVGTLLIHDGGLSSGIVSDRLSM